MLRLTPLSGRTFGALCEGVDLKRDVPEATIKTIKESLAKHRLLIFRDQGRIDGQRQVDISEWFGRVQSTFSKHPRSPHPDVFRVSNDHSEGCTSVGRSGWHIDGTFMPSPFKVQCMHFWSNCTQGGSTLFSPLKEIAEMLLDNEESREFWDALYFVTNRRTDYALIHPLICRHPVTGDRTMCFHLGAHFMDNLLVSKTPPGTHSCSGPSGDGGRLLTADEQEEVVLLLTRLCERPEWCLSMDWREGDFAIIDNLALVHYAHPSTQSDPTKHGLRILHRTTVEGDARPSK